MKEETNKSEEDKLLDPIAKSILRDLQAEADEQAAGQQEQEEHTRQEHMAPPPVTLVIENGEIIKCDDNLLTWNEMVHCNMALEQDGNDADGSQGGQIWGQILDTPLTVVFDNGHITVILDDGTTIRCDSDDADLTENEIIHCKMALEQTIQWGFHPDGTNANPNSTPIQGGLNLELSPPSNPAGNSTAPSSSPSPTTGAPTVTMAPTFTVVPSISPSYHPTLHENIWTLRGTVYYDRNANGERDSNIDTVDLGNDVEYNYGLGGVTIQLMECDPETNKGLVPYYEEGDNSYASAVSQGYDVLMKSKLVGREDNGGKYNLIDIKIDRAYYIYVIAPRGYLFSGGICNDNMPGWKCNYSSADKFAAGYTGNRGRFLRGSVKRTLDTAMPAPKTSYTPPSPEELELGVHEGRSEKCVSVDRSGIPDSHLDVGVMRIGDLDFGDTEVEMNLDLIEPEIDTTRGRHDRGRQMRSLLEVIRGRVLQSDPVRNNDGTYTYVLLQKEKDAIGAVTAEVLASNLDITLPKKGAVLDSVSPIDVVYFAPEPEVDEDVSNSTNTDDTNDSTATDAAAAPTRETDAARDPLTTSSKRRTSGGKLSITVLVRGHSNRDLNVDFDYIVQDSINRDTYNIRRQLTFYNQNCRDQRTKVNDLGFTVDDFLEIHANTGVEKTSSRLEDRQQQALDGTADEEVFSSACNQKKVLPEYFEASLGGLTLKPKTKTRTYVVDEGGASPWAIVGGILAVGVFSLCMGYCLYRQGLKKKQKKSKEMKGTLDASYSSSVDDKIRKNGDMSLQQRRSFTGMMRREISNMALAMSNERSDLAARRQNNVSGREGDRNMLPNETDVSSEEEPQELPNNDEEVIEVKLDEKAMEDAKELNEMVAKHSARFDYINASHTTNKSGKSRTAVPHIFQVDAKDSESEEESSDNDSSSSSDESSNSSGSSSSSSDEESKSLSQVRARKKREKRAASKKRKEKKKTQSRRRTKKSEDKKKKSSSRRSTDPSQGSGQLAIGGEGTTESRRVKYDLDIQQGSRRASNLV